MVTTEDTILPEDENNNPEKGELFEYATKLEQSVEVKDEVEYTTVAVIRWLWGSMIPANEVEKLMKMRESGANDNKEEPTSIIAANDNYKNELKKEA